MAPHDDVSDTRGNDAVIFEALEVIDGALAKMMNRELVSSGEVADLLLDVRTLLTDVTPADEVAGVATAPDLA